ncbi:MAG: AMP-binding protein, partial [Eggerthellaceae bacterium]|nr:AMP-binding protein [Eggerthellaceae bacterium]
MESVLRNVLEWLEADEANLPDKVAFADVNTHASYTELAQKARCAGTFIARNADARQPIALYMDKTVDAICALLGAVYAGCCYSFIDLRQPQARIAKIVGKLEPALVVVDDAVLDTAREVFPANTKLVAISTLFATETDEALLAERRANALASDPLYVNFTSGTTGTPKGVTVGHASVLSFIPTFCETLGLTGDDVFANRAPLDF